MQRSVLLFIGLLTTVFCGFATEKSAQEIFDQANEAYNSGAYEAALKQYQELLEQGRVSEALYFNMGNAYYKMNKVPESIYCYEKALQYAPDDQDVLINLSYARQMSIDKIVPLPQTLFHRIRTALVSLFSLNSWSIIIVLCAFVFSLGFLLYFFSYQTFVKRVFFTISLIALLLMSCSTFLAFEKNRMEQEQHFAILFNEKVVVYSEPNLSGSQQMTLHQGTKVEVSDQLQNWSKIRLMDGREGWVLSSVMKML